MVVADGLIWHATTVILQVAGSLWLVCAIIPIRYAAILAAVLLGDVLATWLTARKHKTLSSEAHRAIGQVSRETGDVLRNARRVVLNGVLDREIWRLEDLFMAKTWANARMIWSLVGMVVCQYDVVGAGLVLLLSLGSIDVLAHRMTVGDFLLL